MNKYISSAEIWLIPLSLFYFKNNPTLIVTVLFIIIGLIFLHKTIRQNNAAYSLTEFYRYNPYISYFLLYCLISTLWSITPMPSLYNTFINTIIIFLSYWLIRNMNLKSDEILNWCKLFISIFTTASIIFIFITKYGYIIDIKNDYMLKKAISLYILIIWSLAIILYKLQNKKSAIIFLIISTIIILLYDNTTAQLILFTNALIVPSLLLINKIVPKDYLLRQINAMILPIISIWLLAMPVILPQINTPYVCKFFNKVSFLHRTIIWQDMLEKIKQRPILGWGVGSDRYLDYSNIITNNNVKNLFKPGLMIAPPDCYNSTEKILYKNHQPHHAHNFPLQIYLNLGIIGIIIAVFAINHSLKKINIANSKEQILLNIITATNFMILLSMSYGIWEKWTIILILISISCFAIASKTLRHCNNHDKN